MPIVKNAKESKENGEHGAHTFPLLYTKLPSTALKFKYFVTSVWMRTRTKAPLAIINYQERDGKLAFVINE